MSFRAVQPETRQDRARRSDKETLEKARLSQRKEKFQRYDNIGNPTEPPAGSAGFCPDSDRFHTDVAGEEKGVRDARYKRQEAIFERKREEHLVREDQRWVKMENKFQEEQEKMAAMKQGTKTLKMSNSVAYDPITLSYHETDAGREQKFKDDVCKYKAAVRTQFMYNVQSREGINPITGESRPSYQLGPAPQR